MKTISPSELQHNSIVPNEDSANLSKETSSFLCGREQVKAHPLPSSSSGSATFEDLQKMCPYASPLLATPTMVSNLCSGGSSLNDTGEYLPGGSPQCQAAEIMKSTQVVLVCHPHEGAFNSGDRRYSISLSSCLPITSMNPADELIVFL